MVAGMMLSQFLPMDGNCPMTTMTKAGFDLTVQSGVTVVTKGICMLQCIGSGMKCVEDCLKPKPDSGSWLEGQLIWKIYNLAI